MKKGRLTALGKLFLSIAGFLYLAMVTSRSSLLLFPMSILLGCVGFSYFEVSRSLRRFRVHTPRYQALPEGAEGQTTWKGSRPAGSVSRNVSFKLRLSGRELFFGKLRPETDSFPPSLQLLPRGVYDLGGMQCSARGSMGLFESVASADAEGELVIYPHLYQATAPISGAFDPVLGGKSKGQRLSNSGTHFAGVRPMQSGDTVKQVHWKTSSKGRGMMVKQFEQELAGRVSIISDCSSHVSPSVMDNALRAAGSLIFAAQEAGEQVDWALLSNQFPVLQVAPFTDPGEVLDRLARIQGSGAAMSFELVESTLERVHRRSSIALVLLSNYDWIPRLINWGEVKHRKLAFYFPDDVEIPELFGALVHKFDHRMIWEK